jgi:hypothetical protein
METLNIIEKTSSASSSLPSKAASAPKMCINCDSTNPSFGNFCNQCGCRL